MYRFAQIAPGAADPGADDALMLGIEVTDPAAAVRCGLGNIDPQHQPGAAADAPAAIEACLDLALPPPGSLLVTIRPDMDSIGAMALLALRAEGRALDDALRDRVRQIAAIDRFDRGAWPGPRPLPTDTDALLADGIGAEMSALAAAVGDRDVALSDRVAAMCRWLSGGEAPTAYLDRGRARAEALVAALRSGETEVTLHVAGRVAVVVSSTDDALTLAYRQAPVIVALNPGHRFPDHTVGAKYTIARWADGDADLAIALATLNALEPGWGGGPGIKGSPQAKPSNLTVEQVVDAIAPSLPLRHVLVASLGVSPPVITETLWGMLHPSHPIDTAHRIRQPCQPSLIHILTTDYRGHFETAEQRDRVVREKIAALYAQYGHAQPQILIEYVEMAGTRLVDVRNQAENVCYANTITRIIKDLAEDSRSVIHLSLAGGRKTMSSYDQAAMMFFGRAQDNLTHVLVEPITLEWCRDFWWPDQAQALVEYKLGNETRTVSAASPDARVDLVDVPFVRLGVRFPAGVPTESQSYEKLIEFVDFEVQRKQVTVDFNSRTVTAGTETVVLTETEFLYFSTLLIVRVRGGRRSGYVRVSWLDNTPGYDGTPGHIEIYKLMRDIHDRQYRLAHDDRPPSFHGLTASSRSRLGTAMQTRFRNPYVAQLITPRTSKERDIGFVGLMIDPARFQLVGFDDLI